MANKSDFKLSVAVVTRNRPESLQSCLESLKNQSYQPFEVVVSDDSDAEYCEDVQKIAQRWGCHYISGPRRGLYANRNQAALACSGSHIRTVDDDHRFPADHFKACFEAVSSDPASIWTAGERGYIDGLHVATCERANQLHPSGLGCPVDDPDDNWAIADGATIYPALIFQSGHRMVEWFGYGSNYLEFGIYLYSHGFKSRCIPDAMVDHYADQSTLSRGHLMATIESQLFSSLCFNLYFHKNRMLALKYIAACVLQSKMNPQFLGAMNRIFEKVKERWEPQ